MDEKSLKSCYVFIGVPGGLSWDRSFCLKVFVRWCQAHSIIIFQNFFMKKMRVCFGLGLNFAGMSHQVMSPASKGFSV